MTAMHGNTFANAKLVLRNVTAISLISYHTADPIVNAQSI